MRKLWIAIGLLACTALAGCNAGHKKPAPPKGDVTCNCAPPLSGTATLPLPAPAPERPPRTVASRHVAPHRVTHRRRVVHRRYAVRHTTRRHRTYAHGSRQYEWNKRDAETSLDIYNYTSGSVSYRELGHHRGYRHPQTRRSFHYQRREGSGGAYENQRSYVHSDYRYQRGYAPGGYGYQRRNARRGYGYEGGSARRDYGYQHSYSSGGYGYQGRTARSDYGSQRGYSGGGYGYQGRSARGYGRSPQWRRPTPCCSRPNPAGSTTHVWIDGYGRRHVYDDSAVAHYAYQNYQLAAHTPERLAPWTGYHEWVDYNGDGYSDR